MTILLVDDDIYSISALTNLLQYEHTLRIASNGQDALKSFIENHYDVVVTDIRMPKMDGIELLKSIRVCNKDTYVIIITGHPTPENESNAEKFGAYALFSKPLDVGGFMEVLSKIEGEIYDSKA